MQPRRLFDWSLSLVIGVTLLGVLGHYMLATNRLLASTQLTGAFHAMRTSILLARAHCQAAGLPDCSRLPERGQIRMELGYPTATQDGIVLAAGLAPDVYAMDYWPGGLFVYPHEQAGNAGCRIGYTHSGNRAEKPALVVDTHNC